MDIFTDIPTFVNSLGISQPVENFLVSGVGPALPHGRSPRRGFFPSDSIMTPPFQKVNLDREISWVYDAHMKTTATLHYRPFNGEPITETFVLPVSLRLGDTGVYDLDSWLDGYLQARASYCCLRCGTYKVSSGLLTSRRRVIR